MREQLIQYIHLLFAGTPNSEDMQQEILQNTLDRYDDLISQGKAPEAAYRLAIAGIGDINEIIGSIPAQNTSEADPQPIENEVQKPASKLIQTVDSLWGALTLIVYLSISFFSGAWYITWLLFPIMALIQKLIHAIGELKGAK